MIPNREGWHYPAFKKLSALLREITSKPHGDFYCLISFFHSKTANSNCIKDYVKIKIFVTL